MLPNIDRVNRIYLQSLLIVFFRAQAGSCMLNTAYHREGKLTVKVHQPVKMSTVVIYSSIDSVIKLHGDEEKI